MFKTPYSGSKKRSLKRSLTVGLYTFALLIMPTVPATAQSLRLEPVSIAYTVMLASEKYGNATLGKIQFTLSKEKLGFSIFSATRAQGLAAILEGNSQESCNFDLQGNQVISTQYSGGRSNSNDYKVDFDWQERKIYFSNGEILDMPLGHVVNTCDFPIAAALIHKKGVLDADQILYVVDGKNKRIRGYNIQSLSNETLTTNMGSMPTLKLVLQRELRPDRTFTFWLSPEHSYLPIKMEERRSTRTTTMMVESIES